jgi:hypothetical protein
MSHPLIPILHELVGILDERKIPYQLMGGLAVRFWAFPRATFDIDLTLSVSTDRLPGLFLSLERAGFTVPEPFRSGFVDQLRGMNKVKVQLYRPDRPPIDIDLFLVTIEYQRTAFARRRLVKMDDQSIWCMTAEDLILHKLIAGRDRDKADVSDLLMAAQPLDLEYLRRWAQVLGVLELLESKIREQSY